MSESIGRARVNKFVSAFWLVPCKQKNQSNCWKRNLFDILDHPKGFYWKGGFDCIVNAAAKNNMNCLLLMRNTKAYSGIYQTREMELFEYKEWPKAAIFTKSFNHKCLLDKLWIRLWDECYSKHQEI